MLFDFERVEVSAEGFEFFEFLDFAFLNISFDLIFQSLGFECELKGVFG